MKLSKAQQAVVDKMREGWALTYSEIVKGYFLKKGGVSAIVDRDVTIKALITKGVIEEFDNTIYRTTYRLTEQ